MENISVSIIIPTFNSEKFIAETIQSIQAQTFTNWELIIVDDGSSDKTVSIISKIAQSDERIQFFPIVNNWLFQFFSFFINRNVNRFYIAF